MAELPLPPDHELVEALRSSEGQRLLRVRFRDRDAVIRLLLEPVDEQDAPGISEVIAGTSPPLTLPAPIRCALTGYAARASYPVLPGIPELLDAGTIEHEGRHYGYVTRSYAPGTDLGRGAADLDATDRLLVVYGLIDILAGLHAHRLVYQDLKPSNVCVHDGQVHLIDLESLRVVPDGDEDVHCSHYTPRYAAPEQVHRGRSGLASDLWALSVMGRQLLSHAPAGLAAALARCDAVSPEERGNAVSLRRSLANPGGATVRVPDPPALTATDESVEEPEAVVVTPPQPRRWGRRMVGVVTVLVGLGSLVATGSAAAVAYNGVLAKVAARRAEVTEASDRLDALRQDLHNHKTVAADNRAEVLDGLVDRAEEVAAMPAAPPEALGLLAVARVWEQRWHWFGAEWDQSAYNATDELTRHAMALGTAEGLLARGSLVGAACRLGPDSYVSRCSEADRLLDAAATDLAAQGKHWLVVEARWAAAMASIGRSARAGTRQEATAALHIALDHCEAAADYLHAAPVNGPELVEDCLHAAGAVGDRTAWRRWARWLVDRDLSIGKVRPGTAARLYRTVLPQCAQLPVDAAGYPMPSGEPGSAAHLCAHAGLAVMGCEVEAAARRHCDRSWFGVCLRYSEDVGVPWAEVLRSLRGLEEEGCALDTR